MAPAVLGTFSGLPTALAAIPESGTDILTSTAPAAPSKTIAGAPALESVYQSQDDLHYARLQTIYKTLTPAQRQAQDKWAKKKASEFAPCPFNFPWVRDEEHSGYACTGGAHYMSDTILAEGIPGLYCIGM
jgi:hypothetical protein